MKSCCGEGNKDEEQSPLSPKLWPKLKLESSGLKFGRSQLARLNLRIAAMLHAERLSFEESASVERARGAVEQAVERLVQRLVSATADLDPRFASKFLVTLDNRAQRSQQAEWPGRRFRYLVRLDALSWPPIYPNTCCDSEGQSRSTDDVTENIEASTVVEGDEAGALPAGWVRVRPSQGAHAQTWAEFLAPSGCLRRDHVVERFATLLSQAAALTSPNPETDESRVCGSPGKVLDAGILDTLLADVQPHHQLFYGPSEAQRCRPPDPRDFQLAVVHEAGSGPVLLRVGLLSPSLQAAIPNRNMDEDPNSTNPPPVIEVRLHIGISLGGWPSDPMTFPARLPLHHPLALLAYRAAQRGYYAVAVGPPSSLRCEERRSAWQTRFPGASLELDSHFNCSSTPGRVLTTLRLLVRQMHEPQDDQDDQQTSLLTVRDGVLRALVRRQLERYASLDAWEPASLAAHVLLCLDGLLAILRVKHAPDFFLPDANLLLPSQGLVTGLQGALDQEEEWELRVCEDAHAVSSCLSRLDASTRHVEEGLHSEWGAGEEEQRGAALEAALLARWRSALNTVSPAPPPNPRTPSLLSRVRGRGNKQPASPSPEHFSPRQLDYIAQVVRELVRFRKATLQHQGWRGSHAALLEPCSLTNEEGPAEDFLFLLKAVLDQALGPSAVSKPRRKSNRRNKRKSNKEQDKQQAWLEGISEAVRLDPPPSRGELALVRHLLLWVWRTAGSAPDPALGRRLARFLASTWSASREGAWHLAEWRRRHEEVAAEIRALAAFCTMLLASQEGWTGVAVLRDAADKGWRWARAAQAELARSGSLQLVLAPAPGVVRRCDVALALQPSGHEDSPRMRSRTLPATLRHRQPAISQDELTLRLGRGTWQHEVNNPSHLRLRDSSPLSSALDSKRRYGQQHALGSLVHAFIAMHRISVLQEVAALLPPADRQPVLDALQRLSRARRLTRSCLKPPDVDEGGRYTAWHAEFPPPKPVANEQPSGSTSASSTADKRLNKQAGDSSILGSCRTARTLQRRHSLFNAFPGELDGCLSMLGSSSPASVRRRYGAGPALRRPGVSLLHLDQGEITLQPEQEQNSPIPSRIPHALTKF